MKWQFIALVVFLTACSPKQITEPEEKQCPVFEIPSEKGCSRDLNDNKICDVQEFAEEIEQQKQQEYEEAAQKALETAERSGQLKRTIMNDVYDKALQTKNYRFVYEGDEVVVANGTVVRKLISDYPLGGKEINGKRLQAVINTVFYDFTNKKTTAQCIPPERLVKLNRGTQCDEFIGIIFDAPFEEFALRLPIEWLEDFLYRTPYETSDGTHTGHQQTTLYRFTDLQDAQRKTNIWADTTTSLPIRVEVWQDSRQIIQKDYLDLYGI
jgi:hypothetical protein